MSLFNQHYNRVCIVLIPRPLTQTLLTNKVLAQFMFFLFSMRESADLNVFSWFSN